MTRKEEQIYEVKRIGAMLTEHEGYVVYGHDLKSIGSYCVHIITPNGNVLTVQPSDWWGVDISIEYTPSRKCGSGCRCLSDDGLCNVTFETICDAETDGLKFAKELGAKLYSNPQEWINNHYARKELVLF